MSRGRECARRRPPANVAGSSAGELVCSRQDDVKTFLPTGAHPAVDECGARGDQKGGGAQPRGFEFFLLSELRQRACHGLTFCS